MLSLLLVILLSHTSKVFAFKSFFFKLPLPSTALGPEGLEFDLRGGGPYTGISDGRIVVYQSPDTGFLDFAFTTPNRSKAVCDGKTNPDMGALCGRPMGLRFDYQTNQLYIADAYQGLLVVGPWGRLATQLATSAQGVPFRFLNAVDVDPTTGDVYFVDASSVYTLSELGTAISSGDATGRLLKYDPESREVSVLLGGLALAGGVAVSSSGAFVLVSEFNGYRVRKYWIRGPRANTGEILLNLAGRPSNIKRTLFGEFWVAVNIPKQESAPIVVLPTGLKINQFGSVLRNLTFDAQYNGDVISEVQEHRGALYVGALHVNFVGIYTLYSYGLI